MKTILSLIVSTALYVGFGAGVAAQSDWFGAPARGFVSRKPAANWEHALVTGNGTVGALVLGNPCDETIYLSHGALYLPGDANDNPLAMAKHLGRIRELCLAGKFDEAGALLSEVRKECDYSFGRDPFIGGFALRIEQPETDVGRYQRAVDFITGEAHVGYTGEDGTVRRRTFVSRADDVVVIRITGEAKQQARLSFNPLPVGGAGYNGWPARGLQEVREVAKRIKTESHGSDGKYLRFQTLFATPNAENPVVGYEGLGRILHKGGWQGPTYAGQRVWDAKEIVLLIKVRPIWKGQTSNLAAMKQELEALPDDYDQLLARHAKLHGDLMSRVSLSLNAPAADRAKATEDLIKDSAKLEAPLAQIERAFDAGRYNIISSTGYNPPNLQGIWAAAWAAPWGGSITTDANVETAIAFLSMGNTPELLERFFAFNERMLPGFRRNTRELYGMRGFHVPAQITASPRITDFSSVYALAYWHAGAPWFCQFYYDHWLHTGDRKFLEERCYPLLKEAAAFYEDFLTVTDRDGKLVFVPSYSPEQQGGRKDRQQTHTCINATMDVGAAKQLLNHAIAAAKELGRDEELRKTWTDLLAKMPPYQVGDDGSFREWLWPDWPDNNEHRHASHLYPLYDEMPAEILENPALVRAVEFTVRKRLEFHEKYGQASFGIVHNGLAAAHVGNADLSERAINELARRYWLTNMASTCSPHSMFMMDVSGGFPYLCASTLVYSDPGLIRFFPARPLTWKSGSIKGLRLRGALNLTELTWAGEKARAVLVSDKDQTVTITAPGIAPQKHRLNAGAVTEVTLERS